MNDPSLWLYHHSPYPLRVLAASLRGYYLRWWRYGSATERLVEEVLARDTWPSARWKAWQEEKLAYMLHRAAKLVPYYREHWSGRRRQGDRSSWEYLENWPVLSKEQLRATPKAFVADDCNVKWLFQEQTSGTTGTPLTLWCKREMLHSWYALFEARCRRWYGVSIKNRWAIIGGQKVAPFKKSSPPFWVWNAGLRQLYLSASHLKPSFLKFYLDAIRQYSIHYLYGYSSALHTLAMQAIETEIRPQVPLKVIVTDAEPLYDHQRDIIAKAFHCPVRESYGQGEMVCAASECEHGRLHLWPEAGCVELLDEEAQPIRGGESGKLITTGLLNEAMPLIRYESMDMAQWPSTQESCACGRGLPWLKKIIGRWDDAIIAPDGRRIVLLDIIFGSHLHIREAQIIQESLERFTVRVVPIAGWTEKDEDAVRSALRERVGNVEVKVEKVHEIERTWAGKFKVLVSKLGSTTPA